MTEYTDDQVADMIRRLAHHTVTENGNIIVHVAEVGPLVDALRQFKRERDEARALLSPVVGQGETGQMEQKPPPVYSILLRTSDYRGDHAADITRAYGFVPGETIEELVARVRLSIADDWIEIRMLFDNESDFYAEQITNASAKAAAEERERVWGEALRINDEYGSSSSSHKASQASIKCKKCGHDRKSERGGDL
jgi:hypothetical protein